MMVDTQVRPSDVTKFPIIDALLNVRREAYLPEALREAAYVGENLAIAPGRVVLEPRTFAKMLDAMDLQSDDLVLDIGAGFGYSTAILARMVHTVVGLEEDADMAQDAQAALSGNDVDNAAIEDGALNVGAAQHGPYDAILIQGGVEDVPPVILEQLKDGGRIGALFMNGPLGVVRVGHMSNGKVTWRDAFNAAAPVLQGFKAESVFAL